MMAGARLVCSTLLCITMQQHSGGARQRHRMINTAAQRVDKQRNIDAPSGNKFARPPPVAAGRASKASKAVSASTSEAVETSENSWHRDGDVDVNFDEARVKMILNLRAAAKAAGDYDKADELRDVLTGMGIDVFDNERVWRARSQPPSMCATTTRHSSNWLVALFALLPAAALAALPPDASGTWAITETRGGQKCTATLMLQPTRQPQSAADMNRGSARYQGVCVDSADGSWIVQESGDASRLAWRLEYERSTVFFSLPITESAQDGTLVGKGDVFAQPRSDPNGLKKVGSFDAKRVSGQWDMRDPAIGRRVTNTALPDSLSRAGL